jgi:alpha-tubulin suppressor-like RCC1 family protein
MDVTNLILYLKSKITDQTIDQQMVSKAIRLLELGAVFTAQSFSVLPTASTSNSGQLWYVLYDGLYWSTGEYWVPIVQTSQSVAWAWGSNGSGQLGDGTVTGRSSPVSVVGGITDWCQVDIRFSTTVALRKNGTAWAWGNNGGGPLGDNTTTARSSPVSVVGGISDWLQISAGGQHTLARRSNGSAWAWGCNTVGQLGDNTTTSRLSPVSVVGGFSDWCQVSGGNLHSLAIRTSSGAWSWGCNNYGQLGDGTNTSRSSPVSVVGGFTDWCQVSAGNVVTVAVRTGGSAWAWGTNYCGHLGDNSTTPKSSPVSVVGGFSDWCQVSTALNHSLAVRTNGTIWAWGANGCGRLGDGTTVAKSSPVSVVGGFTNWCQASAGRCHSVAVRNNGTVWSWGVATGGALGDNNSISSSSPVSVVGGISDWVQVSAGLFTTVALRSKTL